MENVVWLNLLLADFKFQYTNVVITVEEFVDLSVW